MSLIDRVVLFSQHGDIVERAVDPATGKRFPTPSVGVKILAWFARTSWAKRQALKWITAGAAAVAAWMLAHGGTDEQSTASTAGIVAAFTFFYEQFTSWLCNRAKIAPPLNIGDGMLADEDGPELAPPARSLSASTSPFAPVSPGAFPKPSIFAPTQYVMIPDAPTTAEPIQPIPRRVGSTPQRGMVLGVKGCRVIAEKTPDDAPSEQVRGTLRSEADDGTLVILTTDSGVVTLERNAWTFYVACE